MNEPQLTDDELIAHLSHIAAVADPVPELLLSAARDAFALRDLDARVAELVRDSDVDAPVALVRGDGPRMLSFESGDVAVECEITPRAARRDLFGQLVGATVARVDAQSASRDAGTAAVDGDGCFRLPGLPPGPLRLRCHLPDGSTLLTSWTVI
jgi:hypothetical protein